MPAAPRHRPDDGLTRGAWTKLERARQHLAELQRETRQWVARVPWTYYSEPVAGHPDSLSVRVRITPSGEHIPKRFGLLAGDAVHNLRSSLDHLVWALAGANADRINQFPVLVDRKSWPSARGSMLHDVPDAAAATIESYQPYHLREALASGPVDQRHPMVHGWWLLCVSRLDNIDKHRMILPPQPLARVEDARLRRHGLTPTRAGREWIEVSEGVEIVQLPNRWPSRAEAERVIRQALPLTILYGIPPDGTKDVWADRDLVAMTGADLVIASEAIAAVLSRF